MEQLPLVLNDGKISQLPVGDLLDLRLGVKFKYHQAALAAYDRIASISYLDSGLRTERIDEVVFSSALYPDSDITKKVFYADVGLLNQRITKTEITGGIFSTNILRKTFSYSLAGIKYRRTGFTFELI